MMIDKRILRAVALGLVGSAASAACGQTGVVNISGATLFDNFFAQPASTNDYIDANANGMAGIFGTFPPENLAVRSAAEPFYGASAYLAVQYRATGAVNGVSELFKWGSTFAVPGVNWTDGIGADLLQINQTNPARFQTVAYIGAGGVSNEAMANRGNPGALPLTSDMISNLALRHADDTFSGGGVRIDFAISDVPSIWAVRDPANGEPSLGAIPGTTGYGLNTRTSTTKAGTAPAGGGASNLQASLGGRTIYSGTGNGTNEQVFDNPIAYVPIAFLVSYGAGLEETTITDLRHLFATGRRLNGENLMAVTREAGSGTRNGSMNSLGLDPSWAVGENVGGRLNAPSNATAEDNLGTLFVPGDKNGSGNSETAVRNHRLAIGYSGAERGVNNSWLTQNRNDVLGVIHNFGSYGGSVAVRPTTTSVLDGTYAIGGSETLISLGDPQNAADIGGQAGNTHARMRNPYAAAYANNIFRSIDNFSAGAGDPNNDFMPGQFLAKNFILQAAPDKVHSIKFPTTMVTNTTQVAEVRAYTVANSVLNNSKYATFNTANAGLVPTRNTGTVYSDQVAGGASYINQAGTAIAYNSALDVRNKIAGDFNGSGARDAGDVTGMLRAFRQRNGGPVWTAPDGIYGAGAGQQAIIEVLGDFDGNGSFDALDVRYFADGLFMVAGKLDRKAGFTAVDTAWNTLTGSNNFFGTTKSTNFAYSAGDSRADIAGAAGTTRGFAPVGANGVIDKADLNYLRANILAGTTGAGDWSVLSTAVAIDLSCDLTGDLKVNADDLAEFYAIMGTCAADFDLDGTVDFFDYDSFVVAFEAGTSDADFDGDGTVDFFDYDAFVQAFEVGCV